MFSKPFALLAAALLAVTNTSAHPVDQSIDASYSGVGCDNIMLAQDETDTATQNLEFYGQGKTVSFFSYDGDTVAFYCQWRTAPKLDGASAVHAYQMITDQCGLYGAGSYSDKSMEDRTYSYGYTNWRTMDYCNVPAGTRITNPDQTYSA
ncbi:hypothetical protein M409DRAFT_60384 [Zasmidium cellare ATCC 36951]|uniref:AA1-like domain-containing protein n=1 Tax=Zasmidium cellare ATCC 36951 TaxID=1080233 RepID=A0A6A6BZF2_ZASCE|nr:uncharacterized protein M409DRAFT_60384 [Zasmidium cellare ATCC 36951]KAF2159983.1 hypothetical protein M409DRAFT_60384 [Zasmidium cellare ATCC 36951]